MPYKITGYAADCELITVAEVKQNSEFVPGDRDALIATKIQAARETAQLITGRACVTECQIEYTLDAFPSDSVRLTRSGAIRLPLPPLIEVTHVYYQDGDDVEQEVLAADFVVDDSGRGHAWLLPLYDTLWPLAHSAANSVRIVYKAGYGNRANAPAVLKNWMLSEVGAMLDSRESYSAAPVQRVEFIRRQLDSVTVARRFR